MKERGDFNTEIQLLKDKIYQNNRNSEEELFNMKQRLIALHSADISKIQQHYENMI